VLQPALLLVEKRTEALELDRHGRRARTTRRRAAGDRHAGRQERSRVVAELRVAANEVDEIVSLDEIERRYIIRVIKLLNGNKARAAQLLGLDRRTLYRKLERYEARGQRAEGIERQSNVTEQ
jgi:DNA-binding NtrC family response regulator